MLQRITISFSPEERQALDELARAEVRPVKDQVRAAVREAAAKRGLWPVLDNSQRREVNDAR